MLLRRIRLANFRQYRSAEIVFSDGITAIVGQNGSGKTTILEAIAWALYGENRDVKESLQHLWADDNEPVSVTLEFSIGNRDYAVERNFKSACLSELDDGEVKTIATGLLTVGKEVCKLLRLNYQQFKNSFCAEQKELEFLKFQNPTQKQQQVAKMLGFDDLRRAGDLAKKSGFDTGKLLEGMLAVLGNGDEIENKCITANAELDAANTLVQDSSKLFEQSQKALERLEPKKKAAESAARLRQQIEDRKQVGTTLLENMKAAAGRVKYLEVKALEKQSLAKPHAEYVRNELAHKALQEEKAKAQERTKAEAIIANMQEQLDAALADLKALPGVELEKLQEAAAGCASAVRDAESKLTDVANKWALESEGARSKLAVEGDRLRKLRCELEESEKAEQDGKCATCGQPLPDGHLPKTVLLIGAIAKAEASAKGAGEECVELLKEPELVTLLKVSMAEAKDGQEAADAALQRGRIAAERRVEKERSAAAFKSQIEQLEERAKALPHKFDESRLAEVEAALAQLRPSWRRFLELGEVEGQTTLAKKEHEEADAKFDEEKKRQEEDKNRLAELGLTEEQAAKVIEEYTQSDKAHRALEAQLLAAKQRVEYCEKAAEAAKQLLNQYKENRRAADRLEREQKLQTEVSKGMAELRDALNRTTIPTLETYASDTLSALTDGRYLSLKLNKGFEATIVDDGVDKKVMSGGESDLVALSLRLGLAQMIQDRSGQPMSLLILDEAFGSLDEDRRESLLDKLEAMKCMFVQILIISHMDSINQKADRCIEVRYEPQTRSSMIYEAVEPPPTLESLAV
ncbi:MAG: SMC family ATPase [Armatimonadetes bacterium]|nr:SMC family ATPase [Armatimonadota bacterium]